MHLTDDELRCFCPPLPPFGIDTPAGPLPLQAVEITGAVTGLNAALTVVHTFRNDRRTPIEAVYTFPLPDHFAVAGMTAVLDGREVVARIDERTRARAHYEQALAKGRRAALVEQERGDVFSAQLGNLPPGEEARIVLQLAGRLGVDSGEATLRLPLLVGDRYIPGVPLAADPAGPGVRPDTDHVPDASRISPPRRPGPTGVRLGVDIAVVAGGLLTGAPRVSSTVRVDETPGGWRLRVLPGADLDRDLVARIGVRPQEASASAFLAADADDPTQGTWQVVIAPGVTPRAGTPNSVAEERTARLEAITPTAEERTPTTVAEERAARLEATTRTIVLALDRSGSMRGWKMVAARRAAARIVDSLGADDHVLVLGFDHVVENPTGQAAPWPATDRNRSEIVRWLSGLEARGGTELAAPLETAAHHLSGATGEKVLVLLTDGQVGNEASLLRLMANELAGVRVYALGIDHAVNATFLRRLAAIGGGRCDLVESEPELDRVLTQLHRRIAPPLARDVAVEMTGVRLERAQTIPALADVFPSGPTVVQGRWRAAAPPGPGAVSVTVFADTDRGLVEWSAPVTVLTDPVDALRNTWARARVDALQDRLDAHDAWANPDQITEISLAHQVLSQFTAWLAVGPGGVVGPLEVIHQPVAEHLATMSTHRAAPMMGGIDPFVAPPDATPAPRPAAYADEDRDVPEFPKSPGSARPRPARGFRSAAAWLGLTSETTDTHDFADAVASSRGMRRTRPEPPFAAPDLTPFADRLRDLLERCAAGGDPALAREIAELVSDLESVEAPPELIAAVGGLPESAEEVRRVWAVQAGQPLG